MHFFLSYLSWVSADWKNKCWFRTWISGVDMIAKSSLYHYFHFWVSHLLLHTDLKLLHFLEWMSADFQIVWWLFSSLGKPRFDTMPPFSLLLFIISQLIIHLTATYNYSKMYLILWTVGIYSSSFSRYDLKHKKRQNNALITWFYASSNYNRSCDL